MAEENLTPKKEKPKKLHISTDIDFEIRSPKIRALLVSLLAILLVAFIGYHISSGIINSSKELNTKTAVKYTHRHTIEANAFILREEKLLQGVGGGEVVPLAEDGMKVSGNDAVANVFATTADAQHYYELVEVQNEIAYYESIYNTSSANSLPDIAAYDNRVQDSVFDLAEKLSVRDIEHISEQADAVRSAVTKRSIAIGTKVDVSPKLSELYAKRNQLLNAMQNYTVINADSAGYYVHNADGYESSSGIYNSLAFSAEEKLSDGVKKIDNNTVRALLTIEPIAQIAPYGKLITGFEWYIVCSIETLQASQLQIGQSLAISFVDHSARPFKAQIIALNPDGEGRTALILSATAMDGAYAQLRKARIVIETDSFSGLRVENTALRTVEGELGVYIRQGNVVTFRNVEVLYSADDYSVVKDSQEPGYLKTYDEIIIEGTDLYDGKLIK
ncbi:MAG: hypothetical protein IJO14_05000 [Clostridia bacterium]|nr:hypothetical protein [Clostridia bacterium]